MTATQTVPVESTRESSSSLTSTVRARLPAVTRTQSLSPTVYGIPLEPRGFEVLARAGNGAMAHVFRSRCASTGQLVALKRVLPALAHSEKMQQLFEDECRVHAGISHAKIVKYVSHGRDAIGPFLALDWIDGPSARQFVQTTQRLCPAAAVALAIDVLEALAALHRGDAVTQRGALRGPILHRDVSPANVLVGSDGVARLADFGLARAFAFARAGSAKSAVGKLGYLAPEVLAGRPHSARADQYSLGVVLWEVLVGQRLFAHISDREERSAAYLQRTRPRLEDFRPSVSAALASVVNRALSMDPTQRFQSADAMIAALQDACAGDLESGRSALATASAGRHVRRGRKRVTKRSDRTGDTATRSQQSNCRSSLVSVSHSHSRSC